MKTYIWTKCPHCGERTPHEITMQPYKKTYIMVCDSDERKSCGAEYAATVEWQPRIVVCTLYPKYYHTDKFATSEGTTEYVALQNQEQEE